MTQLYSNLPQVGAEPFTAADAPAEYQALGEKAARHWARLASSFYRGRIAKGNDPVFARERAAARATAEGRLARRYA